ncbi:CFEM domain-containing protein [Fusarium keratoplasticum]|nr:CFEM domain-containing protein [Fusarium keratoplasticum]
MHLYILFLVAIFLGPCLGEESPSEIVARLPSCAPPCLYGALANSTCDITDLSCMCTNQPFQDDAKICIESACSFSDALFVKNVTETACGAPVRDKSNRFNATIIPLGAIAIFVTMSRLVFKLFFSRSQALSPDDWAIAATLAISVSGLVIGIKCLTVHGLGRDIWTLTTHEISKFALYFYVMTILYFMAMSFIKLSLSLFYLNIFFDNISPYILWGTVAFNALYGIAFLFAAIFQCVPVDYYWVQYLGGYSGTCVDINALGWVNAATGVAVDIWMIAMPLSQVIHLRLHWKKKVGVVIMFLLGTFVTVVSILRLQSLLHFANSNNPTWDQWFVAFWSIIEVNVGMICTCLPTLRLILVRLCPNIFGTADSAKYGQEIVNQSMNPPWTRRRDPEAVDLHSMEAGDKYP